MPRCSGVNQKGERCKKNCGDGDDETCHLHHTQRVGKKVHDIGLHIKRQMANDGSNEMKKYDDMPAHNPKLTRQKGMYPDNTESDNSDDVSSEPDTKSIRQRVRQLNVGDKHKHMGYRHNLNKKTYMDQQHHSNKQTYMGHHRQDSNKQLSSDSSSDSSDSSDLSDSSDSSD
jgi:hypothetical protein